MIYNIGSGGGGGGDVYFIDEAKWTAGEATVADFNELKEAIKAKKSIYLMINYLPNINRVQYLNVDRVILDTNLITCFIILNHTMVMYSFYSMGHSTSETFQLQEQLTSGTNIKTINNDSILGPGNLTIDGGCTVQIERW